MAITIGEHVVGYEPTESGRRFQARCTCGMGHPRWKGDKPPTRATERIAEMDVLRHVTKVKRQLERERRLTGADRASTTPAPQGSTLRLGA